MNKKIFFGSFLVVIILLAIVFSASAINLISLEKHVVQKKMKPDFSYDVQGCLSDCMDCENIEFIVEGNDLTYIHYAYHIYNCCADMMVLFEMENNLIKFIELEHFGEGGPCDCLCDYELTGTVHDLPAGEYTIEVWGYFNEGNDIELHCRTIITI